MDEEKAKRQFEDALRLQEEWQAAWEQQLQDPAKRRAWELLQKGEELFWDKKLYDDGIALLVQAAELNPEYRSAVESHRKCKDEELRKGRVRLTRAFNRILLPRLTALGLRARGGATAGIPMLFRVSPSGREGQVDMGRTKFGKEFGLGVARSSQDGRWEHLDLATVGLGEEQLRYLNQAEAEAVLERVAKAFEGPILAWLDAPE